MPSSAPWGRIDVARSSLQLAREALVQALELACPRFTQIELREDAPYGDAEIAYQRLLEPAQPAGEQRQPAPWEAIGQQEIQVLLLRQPRDN